MGFRAPLLRLRESLHVATTAVAFAFTVPVMYPFARARRRDAPWVISGHRGRIYADNAAAVHRELVRQGQDVIWISDNEAVTEALRSRGDRVLRRNSIAARWAMLRAPVLIQSHGESDIDLLQILLRGRLGMRVHLNHCMNHVKAGDYENPIYRRLRGIRKWWYEYLVTDFDVLLASSEAEKANFARAFVPRADRIVLGGGAHMDAFFEEKQKGQSTRDIVYFPTFRDDEKGRAGLERVIDELLQSKRLQQWLEDEDLTLKIGAHINTGGYSKTASGRIAWLEPSDIVEAMRHAQLFISDYSGLLFDALILDAPVVFFPFDLEQYLQTRSLFHPYAEIAYGPVVRDTEALIDTLVSGSWRDLAPHADHRNQLSDTIIPVRAPVYAERSVAAIRAALSSRNAI